MRLATILPDCPDVPAELRGATVEIVALLTACEDGCGGTWCTVRNPVDGHQLEVLSYDIEPDPTGRTDRPHRYAIRCVPTLREVGGALEVWARSRAAAAPIAALRARITDGEALPTRGDDVRTVTAIAAADLACERRS